MIEDLGKAIFWWRTNAVAGGDPEANALLLTEAGFQWVAVKVADGNEPYTVPGFSTPNVTPAFMQTFRSVFKGRVYGWEFVTHSGAKMARTTLADQVEALGLDGGIFDVEDDFDLGLNAEDLARSIVAGYHHKTPNPLGWCSWALFCNPKTGGQWHPAKVARAGMEESDFGMPMAYWPGGLPAEVAVYAAEVIRQWRTLITTKPLVLTGRGWTGDGGTASPACIKAFDDRVRTQDMMHAAAGISWWSYSHAYAVPAIWNALKVTPQWPVMPPQPPPAPPGVPLREWAAAITAHLRKLGYNGPDLAPE
jgi:hypothetical protein